MAPDAGSSPAGRTPWTALALAAAVVVIVGGWPSLPEGVRNWDNVVKLQVARNLLRGNGPILTSETPAGDYYRVEGRDGRTYGPYPLVAPALHFLTLGAMRAGAAPAEGIPALVLLGVLAAVLVAWGRRAGASPPGAVAGAMLVCLGTALWPMAVLGYDNVIEAIALAVILWAGTGAQRWPAWLAAGLAVGASVATRYGASVLLVPGLVALAAARPRSWRAMLGRAAACAAGGLPGAVLVAWHNQIRFGSPFVLQDAKHLAMAPLSVGWFSGEHWTAMAGLTLSPGKGLVWYGPPILLCLVFARPLVRRFGTAFLTLALYLASAVLLFGVLTFWHGDWCWGPRYVAPVYVACAPLAWLVFERATAQRALVVLVLALVAVMALEIVPVIGYPVESQFHFVVQPRWKAGRLSTKTMWGSPLPADNALYFEPRSSMIVSTLRHLRSALSGEESRRVALELALHAAIAPLAAAAAVLLAARATRPAAVGAPAGGAPGR